MKLVLLFFNTSIAKDQFVAFCDRTTADTRQAIVRLLMMTDVSLMIVINFYQLTISTEALTLNLANVTIEATQIFRCFIDLLVNV